MNLKYIFGFGLDYSQTYIRNLIPGIPENVAFGGLIPSLIFDYGILGFILLWNVIFKLSIKTKLSFETLFILLIMTNATLNTQLFWFSIIVFSINRIINNTSTSKLEVS